MDFERLHPADRIVSAMERVYSTGLTTTSGGNISILDDDGSIWITPGGVDKGSLTRADIVRVLPGGAVEGVHRPSIELPFHSGIYCERPDVRAVLHAHPSALVAYSIVGKAPDTHMIPGAREICGEVGFAGYAPPGSDELGRKIAEAFRRGLNCVMLENHGAAAAGESLFEAFRAFEMLDYCARLGIEASRLGSPVSLSDEQLALAAGAVAAQHGELPASLGTDEESVARFALCRLVRRACLRGLFTSSMGDFSMRLGGNRFLITPEAGDRMNLEPENLVLVEGKTHEARKRPGCLSPLHRSVYEAQPNVNAVITARPVSAMAFAVAGHAFDTRMIPESYAMLRGMPLLPFGADFLEVERTAALFTPETPAALVQNGCVITTGADALKAFDRLEVAEFSAGAVIAAGGLGEISVIEGAGIKEIERIFRLG